MKQPNYLNRIRNARELFLGKGEVPDGLLPESIYRSWERCLKTGLAVDLGADLEPADSRVLSELKEKNGQLLTQSQAEMENLSSHILGTQSMVILSDAEGTILHAMGDPDFMTKAQRVALQPGVSWKEELTGTNAIGTALVEKTPVFVMGGEHYFERNAFLNCSAAPISDPHGNVIGVLDLSGDHRQPQEHTMALVRMSAQMIENRLFNVNFTKDIIVRFHSRIEFIGTLWEGIATFSPDGKLLAANRSGAFQLGLNGHNYIGMDFSAIFGISISIFLDTIRKRSLSVSTTLALKNGLKLYVKADPGPYTLFSAKSYESLPPRPVRAETEPLDMLDHGDAAIRKTIERAKLSIGHDIPILIEGETGTGKELFAKAIHQSGTRKHGAFVAINCAAIPEGLIESELFGHEEGAFTGSKRRGAMGRVQQAHGGTLFLDEVGEMPLALQARLLRVIQEREVIPLGGSKSIPVDIAIISATNCRLKQKVAKGEFREDLYYRLNGLRLSLPALRDRTDIEKLIKLILKDKLNKPEVSIHPEVMQLMKKHEWRGNVRQLFNVLRSSVIFLDGDVIETVHLPEDFMEEFDDVRLESDGRERNAYMEVTNFASAEAILIKQAMELHHGNMTAVANELGISRATVYRKSKRLGLR